MTASPQLLISLRVSRSGHAGDGAALGQEPTPALPGAHAHTGHRRGRAGSAPQRPRRPPASPRRSAQQPRGGGAALPERLRFRLRCRHFAVRQQRSGRCDAVHRGTRIRALPARAGLRAGGARAAAPLLAVHLQRRVRGPGGQRAGRGTRGTGPRGERRRGWGRLALLGAQSLTRLCAVLSAGLSPLTVSSL